MIIRSSTPFHLLLLLSVLACPNAQAATANSSFTVNANIVSGCAFGNSLATPITNLGTINFGSMSSITNNVDVTSASGTGSIVVTCTTGANVTIAIDYGVNGGTSTGRFMANTSNAAQKLRYQLYQDSGRSQVWGTGTLARTINNFPATTQTYPVYARLFAVTPLPSAGTYSDTVTVTLTY